MAKIGSEFSSAWSAIPRTLQVAIIAGVIYAVLVVVSAGFYSWWSGEKNGLLAAGTRFFVVLFVVGNLLLKKRWAWWVATIGSAAFSLFGILGLVGYWKLGLAAQRPYPSVDIALIILAILSVFCLCAFLLSSPSRRAFVQQSS